MTLLERYSEPYRATGGLAAEGVLNQLGRPDIDGLEVLVREAVQNSWDAKRAASPSVKVEIGRRSLDDEALEFCRDALLVDPPPGLPLAGELKAGLEIMYFADFGTDGLGGPTRADRLGGVRDFVDFVRNIGQPPDKDLGGGSFGYGKAAFYIASRARTILVDTLCLAADGALERRFIGCGLGYNFELGGAPYTGRHWWGRTVDDVPEPVTGEAAVEAAGRIGLPERGTRSALGSTIVIVAPDLRVEAEDGSDETMAFVAEALAWNFWPRMIDTPGGASRTIDFRVIDGSRRIRIPNPRTDQRLREFVEAMDRQREDTGADDEFLLDREVRALRPARRLGRLVVKKAPVAPVLLPDRAVPVGQRVTADALHHVALMRNAELVVRYLPGPVPAVARTGYAGVFKCAVDVDDAFRASEPPTHDNWIFRAVPKGHDRSFVKIALERISGVCREAAGYDLSLRSISDAAEIPLGEFADSLASLLPGSEGPGARRPTSLTASRARRRRAPGRSTTLIETQAVWTDGSDAREPGLVQAAGEGRVDAPAAGGSQQSRLPRPQLRGSGEPEPTIASDGTAVIRYPFELRARGNRVRLTALVEVMASDGAQVESEAPIGAATPGVRAWFDPSGAEHRVEVIETSEAAADGRWHVDVELLDEAMMRVDVEAEAL